MYLQVKHFMLLVAAPGHHLETQTLTGDSLRSLELFSRLSVTAQAELLDFAHNSIIGESIVIKKGYLETPLDFALVQIDGEESIIFRGEGYLPAFI